MLSNTDNCRLDRRAEAALCRPSAAHTAQGQPKAGCAATMLTLSHTGTLIWQLSPGFQYSAPPSSLRTTYLYSNSTSGLQGGKHHSSDKQDAAWNPYPCDHGCQYTPLPVTMHPTSSCCMHLTVLLLHARDRVNKDPKVQRIRCAQQPKMQHGLCRCLVPSQQVQALTLLLLQSQPARHHHQSSACACRSQHSSCQVPRLSPLNIAPAPSCTCNTSAVHTDQYCWMRCNQGGATVLQPSRYAGKPGNIGAIIISTCASRTDAYRRRETLEKTPALQPPSCRHAACIRSKSSQGLQTTNL